MEKEFIPPEEALALKELGFDNVSCFGVYFRDESELELDHRETQYSAQKGYKNGILAPLYQQAFRWFRDEHGLDGEATRYNLTHSEAKILGIDRKKTKYVYVTVINGGDIPELDEMIFYFSKEEAEPECLRKLIEICEKK